MTLAKATREASSTQTWTYSQPSPCPRARRFALSSAVAGDAMADAVDPSQLLDVDVDQLAGMGAFIAAHRLNRLQSAEPVEPPASQDAADGGRRELELCSDLLAGAPLTAQRFDGCAGGGRRLARR